MTQDQAKTAISRTRGAFRLGNIIYEANTDFGNGTVFRQDPVSGRSVPYGTAIDLWIASSIGEEGSSRSIQVDHQAQVSGYIVEK